MKILYNFANIDTSYLPNLIAEVVKSQDSILYRCSEKKHILCFKYSSCINLLYCKLCIQSTLNSPNCINFKLKFSRYEILDCSLHIKNFSDFVAFEVYYCSDFIDFMVDFSSNFSNRVKSVLKSKAAIDQLTSSSLLTIVLVIFILLSLNLRSKSKKDQPE